MPRLQPPPVLDLEQADAPYRAAVALVLQPGWVQFLEDCRLRLPVGHPLNDFALSTTAELTVDGSGTVLEVSVAGSGNVDFDRAVRQVIRDGAPLPKPPAGLWSDDDRVHLRWLFARDRRQAGPATASVIDVSLPVKEVTARLIKAGDLTRAAKRIKREKAGAARDAATTALMEAGLQEALSTSDGAVRRAALAAIGEGRVGRLAEDVYQLIHSTSDRELRAVALETAAALGDRSANQELLAELKIDVKRDRKLALAGADALIALDGKDEVARLLRDEVATSPPNPIALHVLARVAVPAVTPKLAGWMRAGDVRVRSGVCSAVAAVPAAAAVPVLAKGLRDRDASVRTSCLDAVSARMASGTEGKAAAVIGAANVGRVGELVKDRDVGVRSAAIRAFAYVHQGSSNDAGPSSAAKLPDLGGDAAAEVRVAYLKAISTLSMVRPMDGGQDRVKPLLDDRDADVRAAAWTTFGMLLLRPVDKIHADAPPAEFDQLVARATKDSAAQVRRAVVDVMTDDVALIRVSGTDDDGEVRTRALVRLAQRGGRAATIELLLGRFEQATPGSVERVRAALAWHVAK